MSCRPPTASQRKRQPHERRGGFTLIEVAIAMSVAAIAMVGFTQAILGALTMTRMSQESAKARNACREMIETFHATPFEEVFARFNGTALDDPVDGELLLGAFEVEGLRLLDGDLDGLAGEIYFPVTVEVDGSHTLREDLNDPNLALPYDLNSDSLIDSEPRNLDYQILPVRVRVRWRGYAGPASIEYRTLLANF